MAVTRLLQNDVVPTSHSNDHQPLRMQCYENAFSGQWAVGNGGPEKSIKGPSSARPLQLPPPLIIKSFIDIITPLLYLSHIPTTTLQYNDPPTDAAKEKNASLFQLLISFMCTFPPPTV